LAKELTASRVIRPTVPVSVNQFAFRHRHSHAVHFAIALDFYFQFCRQALTTDTPTLKTTGKLVVLLEIFPPACNWVRITSTPGYPVRMNINGIPTIIN